MPFLPILNFQTDTSLLRYSVNDHLPLTAYQSPLTNKASPPFKFSIIFAHVWWGFEGQLIEVGCLLPPYRFQGPTQIIRLICKYLYPLSHPYGSKVVYIYHALPIRLTYLVHFDKYSIPKYEYTAIYSPAHC